MDVFCEYIVTKKKETSDYIIIALITAAALVITYVFMLLLLMFSSFASIILLLLVGAWWGAVQLIKSRSVEYEYILTNHELDIDRIIARSRRKRICSINFKQIDVCASVSDPKFAHIYNNSNGKTVKNLAADINADNVYFVDYANESQSMRVIFQPSKRILEGIKTANMRFVNIKEGDL